MSAAARVLLDELIDYAGLFPPAQLPMPEAVARYAEYRAGARAWMLGRFVIPATRLTEFASEGGSVLTGSGDPWRLSVLVSPNPESDLEAIAAFNASHYGAVCDTAEGRATSTAGIATIARAARTASVTMYVEIPVTDDPAFLIDVIGAQRLRAKIRTGGTSTDAFPSAESVARFLGLCVRAKVPFKATAGLHHPVCGDYPLTYDAGSDRAPMLGFLNVFLAAALLRDGASDDDAVALLNERDAGAFTFGDDGVRWRGQLMLTARLSQLRETAAISFGSCSFAEPVDDLTAINVL